MHIILCFGDFVAILSLGSVQFFQMFTLIKFKANVIDDLGYFAA